jgi:hypothetical protein
MDWFSIFAESKNRAGGDGGAPEGKRNGNYRAERRK